MKLAGRQLCTSVKRLKLILKTRGSEGKGGQPDSHDQSEMDKMPSGDLSEYNMSAQVYIATYDQCKL